MRLFSIQVPVTGEHKPFYDFILAEAGGFNSRLVTGSWRDDTTGIVHTETMVEYQIMCDPALMFDIQQKAFDNWPAEICFFVAELGNASIVYPPVKVRS